LEGPPYLFLWSASGNGAGRVKYSLPALFLSRSIMKILDTEYLVKNFGVRAILKGLINYIRTTEDKQKYEEELIVGLTQVLETYEARQRKEIGCKKK
jgi:hypothetical protein